MKNKLLLPISIAACLVIAVLSIIFGSVNIFASENAENIILYSRLPRTLAALLGGGALALSGGVLQNVLMNKLASPSIIGINAGAGLGVTLAASFSLISGIFVSLAAFFGSLITVLTIALFSKKLCASKTTVILGGVALNSMLSAVSEAVCALNPDLAMLTTEFRVGGFSNVSYQRLIPAGIMIMIAFILLLTLSNELEVVSLGDETASSVGLNANKFRILFLVLAALLAGSAVSFCGLLGFVGLIVPHFVRRIADNQSRRLLPLCFVIGGGFVSLCDLISRLVFAPYEMPVGILMAVVGGPVFVGLIVKTRGGHRGA